MWAITLINEQNNKSLDEKWLKYVKCSGIKSQCDYQTITNTYGVEFCLDWINDNFQVVL